MALDLHSEKGWVARRVCAAISGHKNRGALLSRVSTGYSFNVQALSFAERICVPS